MKIKCLLIDNDSLGINLLKKHLNSFDLIEVLSVVSDLESAQNFIQNNTVDVVFIDIGINLSLSFDWIAQVSSNHLIVITTAYKEYALKSFDVNILDYLIKPISFDRLVKSINKIFQRTLLKPTKTNELSRGTHIFVKVNKKLIRINLNDVMYVESLKDYIRIHAVKGRYVVHKSLTSITEELPKSDFIRVHRSYTISIGKIIAIEGNYIEISTKRIPIGRHYVKEVKKRIFGQSLTINNQL